MREEGGGREKERVQKEGWRKRRERVTQYLKFNAHYIRWGRRSEG